MGTYRSTPFAEATTGSTCNPHGIDSILNKRDEQLRQRSLVDSSEKLAKLSDVEVGLRVGEETVSLSSLPNASIASEDTQKQPVQASCWPGFQGIITNSTLWRDRALLHGEILQPAIDKQDGKPIQWTCGGERVKYFCSTFEIVTPWLKLKTENSIK